ncbi:putative N-acetyltransferase HLS1 [Tasmannia lanceolata]|uniref:putative N-acetyltransferase HLS1 n=1 Tax=Tasmannia lanceolata TaxID=3420 RepID=UPI004063EC79
MGCREIKLRSFDKQRDTAMVEDLEKKCEVGPRERPFIYMDTMGDPMCRIRNSPEYKMLVAELENELVGVIRGSIKIVTCSSLEDKAKVGYVLGLRVSPLHRRKGIGLSLVKRLEEWFDANCVDYAYMATEKDNEASLKLFMDNLGFVKFRSPTILVNPVSHHVLHISSSVKITRVKVEQSENLYRRFMSRVEFFPHDIDRVLQNRLSLGTWVAYPQGESWDGFDPNRCIPSSWAMLSVWNSGDLFKLRVANVPLACIVCTKIMSLIARAVPFLKLPDLPDVFSAFGFYFIYGVHGEGPQTGVLLHSLCRFVHNLATNCKDCKVIVVEVGGLDGLRHHIPHWEFISCTEDFWCIKPLRNRNNTQFNWSETPPPRALFVDPREV